MNDNTGHGHVWARPDGMKARCGGPAICSKCALDFVRAARPATVTLPVGLVRELRVQLERVWHTETSAEEGMRTELLAALDAALSGSTP